MCPPLLQSRCCHLTFESLGADLIGEPYVAIKSVLLGWRMSNGVLLVVWLAWVRELKIEGDCCCGCLLLVVLPDVGNVGNSLDFFFFFFFLSLIFGK